jgi:hypothetical protein
MVCVAICGVSPVFAMGPEKEPFNLRSITPLRKDMNDEQQREAIQVFLQDSLKPESEIKEPELLERNKITRKVALRQFETYTLTDGSEWVQGGVGLDRFLGYLYLKKAMEAYGLKKVCVVETRYTHIKQYDDMDSGDISINIGDFGKISISIDRSGKITEEPVINSKNFCSLSRYVGDKYLTYLALVNDKDAKTELNILNKKIGFRDMSCVQNGSSFTYSNLREKDGMIYIIDTEYFSFEDYSKLDPLSDYKKEEREYLEKEYSSL